MSEQIPEAIPATTSAVIIPMDLVPINVESTDPKLLPANTVPEPADPTVSADPKLEVAAPNLDPACHLSTLFRLGVVFLLPLVDFYTFGSVIMHLTKPCAEMVLANHYSLLLASFILWAVINLTVDGTKIVYAIKGIRAFGSDSIKNGRIQKLLQKYNSCRLYAAKYDQDMARSTDTLASIFLLLDVFLVEVPLLYLTVQLNNYTKSLTIVPIILSVKAILFIAKDISYELILRALERRKSRFPPTVNKIIATVVFVVICGSLVGWVITRNITEENGVNILRFDANSATLQYGTEKPERVSCYQNDKSVTDVLLIPLNSEVLCISQNGLEIYLALSYSDKPLYAKLTVDLEVEASDDFAIQNVDEKDLPAEFFITDGDMKFTFILTTYAYCKI